jgi:hypothetical protein
MTPTSCVVSQLFSYAAIIFRIFLTAEPLCPQNSDRSFSAIGSTQELPIKNKPPAPTEIWTRLRDGLIRRYHRMQARNPLVQTGFPSGE